MYLRTMTVEELLSWSLARAVTDLEKELTNRLIELLEEMDHVPKQS